MKKLLFALVLLASVSFALSNLKDFGCEYKTDGSAYCPDLTFTDKVPLHMTEDVYCISTLNQSCSGQTCANVSDVGCAGSAEIKTPIQFDNCQAPADVSQDKACTPTTLSSGSPITLLFDTKSIDFSKCHQTDIAGLLQVECPYNGKDFTATLGFFNESDIAFVVKETTAAGITFETAVYGGLVIVILLLAYWVFSGKGGKRK